MVDVEKKYNGWVRMKYILGDEGTPRTETRQGYFDNDGNFYFSSSGRGGQSQPFTRFDLITELVQTPNRKTNFSGEQRIVELGPNVIYQYNGISFANVEGVIHLTMMGFKDRLETEIVPQGIPFGGAMPTTIFVARKEPGIAIVQQ